MYFGSWGVDDSDPTQFEMPEPSDAGPDNGSVNPGNYFDPLAGTEPPSVGSFYWGAIHGAGGSG
jgi:hypothetical protein